MHNLVEKEKYIISSRDCIRFIVTNRDSLFCVGDGHYINCIHLENGAMNTIDVEYENNRCCIMNEWLFCISADSSFRMVNIDTQEVFISTHIPVEIKAKIIEVVNYRIVVITYDNSLYVVDISGKVIYTSSTLESELIGVFPLGNEIGIADCKGNVYLLTTNDENSGNESTVCKCIEIDVSCICSVERKGMAYLSCVDSDEHPLIKVLRLSDRSVVNVLQGMESPIKGMAICDDYLCGYADSNEIIAWSCENGTMIVHKRIATPVRSLCCNKGGIFIGSDSGVITYYELLDSCTVIKKESCVKERSDEDVIMSGDAYEEYVEDALARTVVKVSDTGRSVENDRVGKRSLQYSQALRSMKKYKTARALTLLSKSFDYIMKRPQLSIENQNLEEYLLSNRMVEIALFNQDDIEFYHQLLQNRQNHQDLSDVIAYQEDSVSSLKKRIEMNKGSIVIDDAEHELLNSPSLSRRSMSLQSKHSTPSRQNDVVRKQLLEESEHTKSSKSPFKLLSSLYSFDISQARLDYDSTDTVIIRPSIVEKDSTDPNRTTDISKQVDANTSTDHASSCMSSSCQHFPNTTEESESILFLENTAYSKAVQPLQSVPKVKDIGVASKSIVTPSPLQSQQASASEDDFQLYDVTNALSFDDIATMNEVNRRRKAATVQKERIQPTDRYTLTLKRQMILIKLFQGTLKEGDDLTLLQSMIGKLLGENSGVIRLPKYDNSPSSQEKLKTYLLGLDLSFEQIDQLLGDD